MKKLKFTHFVMIFLFMVLFLSSLSGNPSMIQEPMMDRAILYDFPVHGYALKAPNKNPTDWDDMGIISLKQNKLNFVDIYLKLEHGNLEFMDVPIHVKINEDQKGNRVYDLDLSAPRRGFFLNMIISRDKTFIDLACDGGDAQLCYRNLLQRGFDTLEVLKQSGISVIKSSKVKCVTVIPYLSGDSNKNSSESSISFIEMKEKVISHLRNGIKIFHLNPKATKMEIPSPNDAEVSEGDKTPMAASARFYRYKYGIVFGGYDCLEDAITFPEQLASVWEGTDIDYGIYRWYASEAQIKSDLYYYNKYWYSYSLRRGYDNDIVAYCAYVNGLHPGMNPNICPTSWKTGENQWLQPDEIRNLWWRGRRYEKFYGRTYTSVYPDEMIILCLACYGYSFELNSYPYMAHVFVDYGADAFVGASGTSVPGIKIWEVPVDHPDYDPNNVFQAWDNDVFVRPFWLSMVVGEYSVREATELMNSSHNYYAEFTHQEYDWTLGGNIKIMGNPNVKLPPY